jgi:cytochrome c-type biogenesis protein CcmH
MRKLALGLLTGLLFSFGLIQFANAAEALPAADDPALEARMIALTTELRCLVCQNETLAASQASLAIDLKNQIREKLRAGESNVLYRPPLKATTVLLWAGPFGLLLVAIGVLWFYVRRRREEMPPELDAAERARARQLLQTPEQDQ